MEVSILQFKGVDSADFPLEQIVLVGGPNGAGKSSICTAVAAGLAGQAIPFVRMNTKGDVAPVITKAEAGKLVRTGFDTGGVRIRHDTSEVTVVWPSAEVKSKGAPPVINLYAAGLVSIVDMDVKAQVKALSTLMGAIPTEDDIRASFTSIGLPAERVDGLVDKIRLNGWDSVHTAAREHGAKLKGQWEAYAGEAYGSAKAAIWIPDGWEDWLREVADATMLEQVANVRQALEKRLQAVAVADSVLEQLRAQVESGGPARSDIEALAGPTETEATKLFELRAALTQAVEALAALTPTVQSAPTALKCPHCKKEVAYRAGTLVKAEAKKALTTPDAAAIAAAKDAVTAAQQAVLEQTAVVKNLEARTQEVQHRLRIAFDAGAKLAQIASMPAADERPVDQFRDEVRVAEARVEAKRKKDGADRAHANIASNQLYIDLLAPDGMRKRKMLRALDDFNAKLSELCTPAGYKLVAIDEELTIRYGGRSYYLLSASEQYRVRAILAIAAAFSDPISVVILDGADILDSAGRNGLFALLSSLDIRALIGMTMNKPDQLPDLGKFGIGTSYWIAGGVMRARAEVVEEA